LWYPAYAGTTAAWGLTPLEDQQLGGAIMWVPSGVVFIAVAMVLMSRWISESDRRLKFGSLAALLEKEQEP
jgi:putative membrane protein